MPLTMLRQREFQGRVTVRDTFLGEEGDHLHTLEEGRHDGKRCMLENTGEMIEMTKSRVAGGE